MPITDFTFNNPIIKDFFEGKSEHKPVAEFMYVHTHIVQSNFLTQIEALVLRTNEYFLKTTKKKGIAQNIREASEKLAPLLNNVSEQNASEILDCLKVIYQNCKLALNETDN